MPVYAIACDSPDPDQEFTELHDAIQELGDACRVLESCWVVECSGRTTEELRDTCGSTSTTTTDCWC